MIKKVRKLQYTETPTRSIVKAITYRVLIVISIFVTTYITTHNLASAVQVTGIAAIIGTIIYYFHERAWSLVKWGRK